MDTLNTQFIEPPKPSHKKEIIIIASVAGAAIIGFGLFFLFWAGDSSDATMTVTVPDRVQAGVAFPLTVAISNDSNVQLKDVQAVITLPPQFVFVGPGKRTFDNSKLGDLDVGKLAKEDFRVIPLGAENTLQPLKVVISYLPGAFRSRFEKVITKDIVVGEAGVSLDVVPPTQVFAGEQFTTEVTYKNNSTDEIKNAKLHLIYPGGFAFVSAEPLASEGNNSWNLGNLAPGAQGTVKYNGSLSGQAGAVFDFRLEIAADAEGETYAITQKNAAVSVAASPLSLQISLEGDNQILSPGNFLTYNLDFTNNTEIGLNQVIITAKLTGEMFDLIKLKSDGALRASDDTAVWNASRVPALNFLAPGAKGRVSFSVPIKSDYPIKRLSSKNFTVRVNGAIESPTVPRSISATKTMGVAVLENKIRGKLALDTQVYFRDAGSGIINQGSLPPKVGQATQYTVHWVLKNYATDADGAIIRAFLGANVRFIGQAKSNIAGGPLPVYDERTQEVSWNAGKIPANRGILSPAYEAIFQIEIIPAINQTASSPALIRESQMSYQDLFTGESLAGSDNEVTTQLPDDKTIKENESRVTQ